MDRTKKSIDFNNALKRIIILLLLIVMTAMVYVPERAYAEVMDTSSGIDAASMSDSEFRQYLVDQGFPESYVTPLMALHKSHPSWVFQAANTGLSFESVITKESQPGINVVASSLPVSYRSKASGCYDSSTGLYISYDSGGWYTATPEVIRYYMDPRNFFDDYGIFQFMTHSFDSSTQTKAGLTNMVSTTFLRNAYPKVSGESTTFATYSDAIYQAGKISGVNPYVIASIIIVEQGANGGGACISGTEPGYENIFNFFNIEAYAWGGRSAVANGLIYAMGSGSYNRPWNTRYKSILGGGKFYYEEYVEPKQNTLYFKKFNVMNGLSSVATHQYMSNVQGAYLEAYRLKKAYDGVDTAITFVIPVYKNMASSYTISGTGEALSPDGTNGYICDYDGINVRSDASTKSDIVTTLIGECYVKVTSSKEGNDGYTWFKISYLNKSGYVRSDLIKVVGWIWNEQGYWHYYNSDGVMAKYTWINDGKGWCWIEADGRMATSTWHVSNGEWYYMKSSGYMASEEWINDGTGWSWLEEDGKMPRSKWVFYDKNWYYIKSNGYMASGEWINDGTGWSWLEEDGKMPRSKWVLYDKNWYYIKSNGYMASNEWIYDGNGWCWLESSGRMVRSQWLDYGGKKYCFANNGYMYSNGTYVIDNEEYTFDVNGALTNENSQTSILCNHIWDEGVVIEEPTYDSTGTKKHVCTKCGEDKMEEIPVMPLKTGWEHEEENWYYYDSDGSKVTGWQSINGAWYYFDSSCAMHIGWLYLDGTWYYLNPYGLMLTGWQEINGKYYYLKASGAMASNEWVYGYWWLSSDGVWVYKYQGFWRMSGDRWWFGDSSGWYAKDETITINGTAYTFDSSGWLL